MRVLTASTSSTSDLATNSTRSFMLSSRAAQTARDPLLFGLLLLQDRLHGGGQLRALADPVIDALAVDLHVSGVLLRIVVADLLHGRRARRPQRVRDHDAIERRVGGPAASQANLPHKYLVVRCVVPFVRIRTA